MAVPINREKSVPGEAADPVLAGLLEVIGDQQGYADEQRVAEPWIILRQLQVGEQTVLMNKVPEIEVQDVKAVA